MADQDYSSPPESAANTSRTGDADSDREKFKPVSSSFDAKTSPDGCSGGDKNASCRNQSSQSNVDIVSSDASVKNSTDSRNGVSEGCLKKSLFLRPSALSGGFTAFSGGHNSESPTAESPSAMKCPLKSPKLNLAPSKFGSLDDSSSSSGNKLPFQQLKNPFSNAVSFDNDKNESLTPKNNVLQTEVNVSGGSAGEKLTKPFSSLSSTKLVPCSNNSNSTMLTTNFVFGQNLHERVADGVAASTTTEKVKTEESSSNGTSDMLFTSVLTSKEIKENLTGDGSSNREPFSLIEDAARCQEARANKRKYEEVLVTTGEEDEENILQVNVKLYAFDSGAWVERGRGILRLNDKNCDGTVISRIVIRTVGSLRVVLNTKIWSGMALSRASERSISFTAMDPNGQLKIFLIQASPKDMNTLFRYVDTRLKRCQDNQGEPEKKKLEKVLDEEDEGGETKT